MTNKPWWYYPIFLGIIVLLRKLYQRIAVFWYGRQKAARLRGQGPKSEMMLLNSLPIITVIIVVACAVLIVMAIKTAK
jgi:hypothetical protein